jgi:class 3 adenylate cyclase
MTHIWSNKNASERIQKLLKDVEEVDVLEYVRDMSLENIPKNRAYRSDSVHLYIDILNLDDILGTTDVEGTTCHKRALKFLNLHYRAVHRILNECNALKVDFHNQRLHAAIFKPYDSEEQRIRKAVAIAQLIIDVLDETGDESEDIPNAQVRVGIDSGRALIVNNGRRGGREPLFLGAPANEAAKLASDHQGEGIYLTNNARNTIGIPEAAKPKTTALTSDQIKKCQDEAALEVDKSKIVEAWKKDLKNNPIGAFEFSGHTPPMSTLDIEKLTPGNSRRQELVSIYADISGFTSYVHNHIDDDAEDVVRVLHVIRSELDNVLTSDFEGRKIRFIGDCLHGVFCLGTAQTTETENTLSEAVLCAGALRSSFNLALKKLKEQKVEVDDLGLGIGFDYGQTPISRLGIHGGRVRCVVSRSVLAAEFEQSRCDGHTTAIGQTAYKKSRQSVKDLFGDTRSVADLDYLEAVDALADKDASAKKAKEAAFVGRLPGVAAAANLNIRPFTDDFK